MAIVSRSDLKPEPPFAGKFHSAHLCIMDNGDRHVVLHGPDFYPDGLHMPETRYRWSVEAGRILSMAEFDHRLRIEKGTV